MCFYSKLINCVQELSNKLTIKGRTVRMVISQKVRKAQANMDQRESSLVEIRILITINSRKEKGKTE